MRASPYAHLDRPPLPVAGLRAALARDGDRWRELRVVDETASTNRDVAGAASTDAPAGLVVVAEHQYDGRGRLDRSWQSPARAGLTFSVLLRPQVARNRWGLLPLLGAVAAARALRRHTAVEVGLKWPNDLVVGDRKLAGILAEVVGEAVVVGLGLNVSTRPDELPAGATSLSIETGEPVERPPVLLALLREVADTYDEWEAGRGAAEHVLAPYRRLCSTLGADVRATLPGGETLTGRAVAVDGSGRLVIELSSGERRTLAAGDVTRLRRHAPMPDQRNFRNVGANTAGTDAAGSHGAQTMNAMSAAEASSGSPGQRPAEGNEARTAEIADCDRCGRRLGKRDFVRRTAVGNWRHEACPPEISSSSH